MKKWKTISLFISIVIWIICNNCWVYTSLPIYHFGIAQVIFTASLIIYKQPSQTNYQHFVSRMFLYVAVNNLVDELLFDPLAFEVNEYISFLIFLIHSLWIFKKSQNG